MSEQHDSEVLFPWEMEKGTGAVAEGGGETNAEGVAEGGREADAAADTDAAADATPIHPSTHSRGGGVEEAEGEGDRFTVLDTELARKAAERANAALRDRPIAPKEYYAISEVCELVGLKSHVLRYWETQFQVLNPSKNRSGNRVYQRKEIRLIMLVKHLLYEEKYTVEGAKAKLDQLRRGGAIAEATGVVIDHAMVEALRADLTELNTLLTPPQRA